MPFLAERIVGQDLSTRSSTALGREQFGLELTAERLGPNGGSLEVLRSSRSGQPRSPRLRAGQAGSSSRQEKKNRYLLLVIRYWVRGIGY